MAIIIHCFFLLLFRSEGEPPVEPGNTLDRIVKDKEGVQKRLEEEEREFLNKKREAERKMIDFEKQVCNSSPIMQLDFCIWPQKQALNKRTEIVSLLSSEDKADRRNYVNGKQCMAGRTFGYS